MSEALPPLGVGQEPYPGYRLREVLGEGAFGQVWEAERVGGPNVALKFMPFASSSAAAKEIRAVQNIRQLQHPGLVQIERIWSQPGYVVICMELAEGSLMDLYESYQAERGTSMPAEEVCRHLTQVAEALDFLNARQHLLDGQRVGIQHCDVKPSNILLFGDQVKLCDFGLTAPTASQVRGHRRQGTPDYAAPEVFQGRLSHHSDQYSLAITFCVLRSGKLPFPSVNKLRASWPLRRPTADLSMLSDREQPIIARALRPVPQERWPSCCTLMAELRAAVDGATQARGGISPVDESTPRNEQRRAVRYACVLAAVDVSGQQAALMPVLVPGWPVRVLNISRDGIGIHAGDQLDEGTLLTIRLYGETGKPSAPRQVRIIHATQQGDGTWTGGASFIEPIGDDELQILLGTDCTGDNEVL